MQRINNKVKKKLSRDSYVRHPGKFLKQDTSGRLRQRESMVIADEEVLIVRTHSPKDKHALRKQTGHCPVCISRLKKNKKGTRYSYICEHCKAQLKPEIRCPHCNTNRVWSHKSESRCKGCGNEISVV